MILRPCVPADLTYLIELEQKFSTLGFIGCDSLDVHQGRLSNPDVRYSIIAGEHDAPCGYVILCGLASENRAVELKRIVIAEPGRGLGRQALRAVIDIAFGECSAHRLWLDVFEDNARARHLYRSSGFVEEGLMRECVRRNGKYRSLVVMSMLENEYAARNGNPVRPPSDTLS